MAYVLIHHAVARYEEFEVVFNDDEARRRRMGSLGGSVFRDFEDPSDVFIVLEWSDTGRAKEFAAAYELQEAMKWATSGADRPEVWVVDKSLEADA
ncbi:MAG: hypothetical protein GX113_08495 [Actinobacteria bacterium]|jgi:hypothetical protein|nr:hypothetical protein [Actinomycetota bacterium]